MALPLATFCSYWLLRYRGRRLVAQESLLIQVLECAEVDDSGLADVDLAILISVLAIHFVFSFGLCGLSGLCVTDSWCL